MKKRVISVLICFLLLTTTLAGCGGKKEVKDDTTSTESTTEKPAQESESSKETVAATSEKTTLKMWTIATESDSFHNAFQKSIADYEAVHPDVKIEMDAYENESYKTKIKTAVAANELPDIFFSWGGGFSESFVEAGKALEIDSYYETYKDVLPEGALKYATYNDKLYGVPYTTPISTIFYNKKMFEEQGLQAPETWDEFITVCNTFINKGITPIGITVKDSWVLAMTNDAITLKCVGDEKMEAAFMKQGQSYNDPEFLDAAERLKQLIDMKAFSEGATGITNDEAVATLLNGTVPMFITGSWLGGQLAAAENAADFDAIPFPVCSDNATLTDFMGGSVDILMVNAVSENKDLVANAAFEIAKGVSKYSYLDGAGIAAWKVDYDVSGLSAITNRLAEYATNGTSFTVWSGSLMTADDYGEYLSLLQEFYVGNIDAQGFIEAMDEHLSR